MRTPSHRAVAGLILFAVCTGLLTVGLHPARGQLVPQAVPAAPQAGAIPPGTAEKKDKSQAINVMTFPVDRDAKQMIEAVQQYLKEFENKYEKAPWDKICFAAQQVLDAKSDSFFEVARKGDETGKFHGVSAKAEANRLIGQFPTAGRQFYQLNYGANAQTFLNDAVASGYDRTILSDISLRFFHTKAGGQATLLLAGIHLDRGNYSEAAYSFERLLTRPDSDDLLTVRTVFKAIVALKRGGSQQTETVKQLWDRLEKKFPRNGLVIGRRSYSLDELRQEANRPFETFYERIGEAYTSMRYGNASHTAVGDGGAPFLDPAFTLSMTFRTEDPFQEGTTWINQNLAEVLKNIKPEKGEAAIPGFFPVTTQNLIIYRTYDGVYATITKDGFQNHGRPSRAGDLYWISSTDGSLNQLMGGDEKAMPHRWWDFYRQQPHHASILFDNPLVGSLTHDGSNVYFVDDLALPQPPQQNYADFGVAVPAQVSTGQLNGLPDGNRLKAVNIDTGKIDWVLGSPVLGAPAMTDEEEDKATNPLLLMQNSFFLGPPLALNGKLYVLFERGGRIRLACLDPNRVQLYQAPARDEKDKRGAIRYPELLWTQKLGEPNTRLPADTIRRFQCSFLAYADGVMVCPTNAGAIVAVDVMSRSLLWAQSYRFIKVQENPQAEMRRQRFGGMPQPGLGGGQSQLTADRWRAAAPIIANGRVVFAAFDSDAINCLDLRTGAVLWTEPRRPGDLYVGGVVNDKVVVVGKESVRAIHLVGEPMQNPAPGGPKESTRVAWKDLRIGTPAGHGAPSKGGIYYIPLAATPDGSRPEVWAIDVDKGQILAKTTYRKKESPGDPKPMLGNLVFHEGQLFSQSPTELAVFPLLELKEEEMNRLLAANPKDPVGLVARGELLLDRGKWKEAVADFKDAEKHDPPESIRQKLRDKLYVAYTELLRKDFPAGEAFLPEYEKLCEVSLETDDANMRQRLADEQFKRKALYYSLLAKGREGQGRLAEAFDHYREFAVLGKGKQLVAIYDEPNALIRPDVWVRGRIEAMIRGAKDPAARKPLEERVAREWDGVRSANDLPRLREFVRVFGPFFAAGRDGQLLLARKLLETNNEEDLREAQTILLQVSSATDDRTVAARSIEMLARLMTRNGMLEDAVGLYAQLGGKYPDVPVRDGKTGADFLNDLLTDKRLLPYLEPTRVPTPARIKVEQQSGSARGGPPTGFTFEPDGELLPFFRRFRLSLSNNESQNGTWVFRVSDRNTGEERCKFPNLRLYAPSGVPHYRVGTASGHLLLLHLGHIAYCFDLAEKKELWQYNLLGDGNRIDPNPQPEMGPDGETSITYTSDGFKIRFGRSTVLEANYACLLTRDGLVALDPATGAKLWTRSNVSLSAQVFGDARHVFLVESEGGKAQSRVLRAVDGAPVEGVKPFGELFTGTARVRVAGRLILLNEGGNGKPRRVRLYDPLAGTDVWVKEYGPASKFIDTPASDYVGVIEPTGQFDVLDPDTGKAVFTGQLDAANLDAHLKPAKTPTLLHDAERFYLLLNKNEPAGRRGVGYSPYKPLRDTIVSGPVYAFDRASGQRLWYTDKLFENQSLITERFADTPALVAASQTMEEGTNVGVYRVIVVDKQNGKIRYLKPLQQQGVFTAIVTDNRDGSTNLVRGDVTVRITADEPEKTAVKP